MSPVLNITIHRLIESFSKIPPDRKVILINLAGFLSGAIKKESVYLNFICTHNSRRSQMAQAWATVAIRFYSIPNLNCVSGGTEITAFHANAARALTQQGFQMSQTTKTSNPIFQVEYQPGVYVEMFSKIYLNAVHEPFFAVMVCDHADKNCPIVQGSLRRFSLPFIDPGFSDGSGQETEVYLKTADQIGRELLYVFSLVSLNKNNINFDPAVDRPK